MDNNFTFDDHLFSNDAASSSPSPIARHELKQAAAWAKFVSISLLVLLGISFLVILGVGGLISQYTAFIIREFLPEEQSGLVEKVLAYSTVLMLGITAVAIVIQVYCLRFAMNMGRAIRFNDQNSFSQAWLALRNQFRWWGIFSAITGLISLIVWILIMMA
jgi:hypothetical protein